LIPENHVAREPKFNFGTGGGTASDIEPRADPIRPFTHSR
jgi:hypothetical protein